MLDILFAKEEQKTGIMFGSEKSPKQPLDQQRVALLFGKLTANKKLKF